VKNPAVIILRQSEIKLEFLVKSVVTKSITGLKANGVTNANSERVVLNCEVER